jgi:uncharacterized membrane protein
MTTNSPSPTNSRLLLLTIPAILLTALLARSLSLQWSPLPYNIDGLSELRVSQDILASNHLSFPPGSPESSGYVTDMPLLGLFSAFFSSVLGTDPATSPQLLAALLGAVTVSIFLIIFRQHWPSSSRGALASALSLSLMGSFVFSSGCAWKESLGFVLLALSLYAFPLRRFPSYRLLMTSSLLLFVFTHHLITIVGYVIVSFAVALDIFSKSKEDPRITSNDALDLITVGGAWSLAVGYYWSIHLPYLDFLRPDTDLYLYIAVGALILMTAIKMSLRDRPLSRLPIGLAVPLVGAALMVYNYYHPIFTGIPGPASLIAVPFLAYLILVVPAWEGASIALPPRGPTKNLLLAMILGPLSLVIFAFLRSNDATSQLVVYRAFDFLMPAFAILVGLGFAFMVKGRPRLGVAAGISLVIICASTLPIAYNTQELFGVENQTYEFEYDAVKWFSENGVANYSSDQRLGETGNRLFDLGYGRGLPYYLSEGLALNGSSYYLLEGQWTTKGAQEFPFGVVVVPQDKVNETLFHSTVFYIGGPAENNVVGFRTL